MYPKHTPKPAFPTTSAVSSYRGRWHGWRRTILILVAPVLGGVVSDACQPPAVEVQESVAMICGRSLPSSLFATLLPVGLPIVALHLYGQRPELFKSSLLWMEFLPKSFDSTEIVFNSAHRKLPTYSKSFFSDFPTSS